MCTAIRFNERFFGRTFDFERSFGEQLIISPRESIRLGESKNRYGILGIGVKNGDTPLYFDGINEWGLCSAALNFPHFARYSDSAGQGVWSSHLNSLVLGYCRSVAEAREMISHLVIRGGDGSLPESPLHWMIADATGAIVIEPTERGCIICDNPCGTLTNSPPLDYHMSRMADIVGLSRKNPTPQLYCRGLGAVGLPGDYSSSSRFLRAAFLRSSCFDRVADGECKKEGNAATDTDCTMGGVGLAMDVLSAVSIPRGAVLSDEGEAVYTRYRVVMDMERPAYYLTTSTSRSVSRLTLTDPLRDGKLIVTYPLYRKESITEI